MKKIFTLVALLAGMATAALGGPFTWTGTGATYDETLQALILENANLTELTVKNSSDVKAPYIFVRGANNTISPTSKKDGLVFDVSAYQNYVLYIIGRSADAKLVVEGQSHSGFYLTGGKGTLYMAGIDITFRGKLQDAQYGVDAATTNGLSMSFGANVQLTLDGKTAPFNNTKQIILGAYDAKLIYPVGGSLNLADNNNFVKDAGGNQYFGKIIMISKYDIEVGKEKIYRGEENFTAQTSGSVSIKDGILTLDNAVIDNELYINSPTVYGIKFKGTNVINGQTYFYMGREGIITDFLLEGEGNNASFTVNGKERFGVNLEMTVKNVAFRNYYTPADPTNWRDKTFCLSFDDYKSTMVLGEGASIYVEAPYTGIADYSASAELCIGWPYGFKKTTGTTAEGNNYVYIREVEDYGIKIHKNSSQSYEVNSENYADPLGDGTVSYNPDNKRLTLKNANLMAIDLAGDLVELYSEQGTTNMITGNGAKAIIADLSELVITGPGSLNVVTQNNNVALYCATRNTNVEIVNTNLNISSSSYAIQGAGTGWEASVAIDNSNVSLQSGIAGLLDYVNAFTLDKAEFVSPADVSSTDSSA